MITVDFEPEFDAWRVIARDHLARGTRPGEIMWSQNRTGQAGFGFRPDPVFRDYVPKNGTGVSERKFHVDPEFLKIAQVVAAARDDDRWDLLYRTLYRLKHENANLMKITIDADVLRLRRLAKNIARDIHKVHAFVRFKEIEDGEHTRFVAWHEPEHRCLKLAAPFFMRRFGDRRWSIFTPDLSAHWDLKELTYETGIPRSDFPHEDDMDEIWKTYYKSIFNPARVKIKAMQSEMPMKFWQTLPEAEIIRDLIREAPARLETLARNQPKAAMVPAHANLAELKSFAKNCEACPLFDSATQTVFGEGPLDSEKQVRIAIIGEQPGDNEDLEGRPFVGPAGTILNRALELAGLSRQDLFLTNAVKHFKYKPVGKTRLHQKPSGSEMHACRPWLEAEIALVKPQIVVLLGATAGTSWLGRLPRVTEERGRLLRSRDHFEDAILSWHPSAILRANSDFERDQKFAELVSDLNLARLTIERSPLGTQPIS